MKGGMVGLRVHVECAFFPKDVAAILAFRVNHYGEKFPTSKAKIVELVRKTMQEFGASVNDEIGSVPNDLEQRAREVVLKHFPEWSRAFEE